VSTAATSLIQADRIFESRLVSGDALSGRQLEASLMPCLKAVTAVTDSQCSACVATAPCMPFEHLALIGSMCCTVTAMAADVESGTPMLTLGFCPTGPGRLCCSLLSPQRRRTTPLAVCFVAKLTLRPQQRAHQIQAAAHRMAPSLPVLCLLLLLLPPGCHPPEQGWSVHRGTGR
jgi:hypothetical protein